MKLLTEEEMKNRREKCRKLFEEYDPKKYNTLEEKIKACNGISLEAFRQMGINIINEIYGKGCQEY